METKIERDFLGEVAIPTDKLYGACTQRTLNTCALSGHLMPAAVIQAIIYVKKACAWANFTLKKLSQEKYQAIIAAADEALSSISETLFPVTVFQNGAGTSTNMNVNEVIAGIAQAKLGVTLHPNDDVNSSQSTNDVIPTAYHVALMTEIQDRLMVTLKALEVLLEHHSQEWNDVIMTGRTHLQDAVPMTLGQLFGGYAQQIKNTLKRCAFVLTELEEIPLGGTAVGTGLNTPEGFSACAVKELSRLTRLHLRPSSCRFCEISSKDATVMLSGVVNSITSAVGKMASDLRLLASGPMTGMNEVILPATQAGSSIMPGKINPAMCEMLLQATYYVNGMMHTVVLAARQGELQLNTAICVNIYAMFDALDVLTQAITQFMRHCLKDLVPNKEKLNLHAHQSLMIATTLAPMIGYEKTATIVKKAQATGKTIAEILREMQLFPEEKIQELCDPARFVG